MILLHLEKHNCGQMVQKLPLRKFVIGDNANVCSETLLTPLSVLEKMNQ